jgi:pantothenate synthetase
MVPSILANPYMSLMPPRALAIPRALATRDPTRAHALLAEAGIEPDYVAVADLDGPTLAVAARIGSTRLIDNVLLEGEQR